MVTNVISDADAASADDRHLPGLPHAMPAVPCEGHTLAWQREAVVARPWAVLNWMDVHYRNAGTIHLQWSFRRGNWVGR